MSVYFYFFFLTPLAIRLLYFFTSQNVYLPRKSHEKVSLITHPTLPHLLHLVYWLVIRRKSYWKILFSIFYFCRNHCVNRGLMDYKLGSKLACWVFFEKITGLLCTRKWIIQRCGVKINRFVVLCRIDDNEIVIFQKSSDNLCNSLNPFNLIEVCNGDWSACKLLSKGIFL